MEGVELEGDLSDLFEGKMTIDNPAFLKIINAWAGVELKGSIPDLSGLNFIVGNYAGREAQSEEEDAFLDPTIWSLFKFFEEAMKTSEGKIYAVARDSIFKGIDDRVKKAVEDHIIYAVKKDDGTYKLKSRWGMATVLNFIKKKSGVFWTAPAASTDMGGLPLIGMTTSSVKQAMKTEGAKLITLTMETDKSGEKAKSIRLDEVDLPEVEWLSKDISKKEKEALLGEIYFQILRYSFAQVASFLPEEQRGQYPEPELAMQRVIWTLIGINTKGIVKLSGGFMS